jgi:hypothetical protein
MGISARSAGRKFADALAHCARVMSVRGGHIRRSGGQGRAVLWPPSSCAQHCRQPWRPPTVQNVLLSNAVRVAVLDSECTSVITNRRSSHRCVMSDPARTTSRSDTLCIRPGVRSQYRELDKSPRRTEPVTGKMLSLSDSEVSCTFVRLLWNPSGCQPPYDGIYNSVTKLFYVRPGFVRYSVYHQ